LKWRPNWLLTGGKLYNRKWVKPLPRRPLQRNPHSLRRSLCSGLVLMRRRSRLRRKTLRASRGASSASTPNSSAASPAREERPATRAAAAGPETDKPDSVGAAREVLQTIALVIAPTTLITALLFFFGWTRTTAAYRYFGIDQSLLDFSTRDYLIRSPNSAFAPLFIILLVALLWLWLHEVVSLKLSQAEWLVGPLRLVTAFVGLALMVAGLLGWLNIVAYPYNLQVVPLCLAVGVAFLTYARSLQARLRKARLEQARLGRRDDELLDKDRQTPRWLTLGWRSLVAVFIVVNIFAAATSYAEDRGEELARQLGANLQERPSAVIYSSRRLQLRGPGVRETEITDANAFYHFRYTGLRLLVSTADKYFLLPAGWSPSNNADAFVLANSDLIRVEFSNVNVDSDHRG
jgi:hypothetical protein